MNCTYYHAYAVNGCLGGLFVEGSIEAGGVSIGLANEMTASLAPEQFAETHFEDYTGRADGFRITGATCHPERISSSTI